MVGAKERKPCFEVAEKVSERELVCRAKGGDEEAIDALFGRVLDKIYNFVFWRVGGDRWEAEDLTAKTLLKAVEHFDRFEPRDDLEHPFSSWVYKIARRLVNNWWRDRKRRRKREIPLGWIVGRVGDEGEWTFKLERLESAVIGSKEESPEEVVIRKEEQRELLEALRELPQHYQDALVLRYTAVGLSNQDIGAVLGGRSEEAVKSLLYRARLKLREKLEERGFAVDNYYGK